MYMVVCRQTTWLWTVRPHGCLRASIGMQGIMGEVELLKNLNHRNIVKCARRWGMAGWHF